MSGLRPAAAPAGLGWLRISLVFVWLWTAAVSAWEWHGQSLALLDALPPAWAGSKPWLIGAGIAVDAAVGLWLLCRKAPVLPPRMPQAEHKDAPRTKQPKGRKK